MNDNVYGFDFNLNNCYHISDDFNYISNAANSSALSDILSNPSSVPVTSSLATSSLNPSLQPNISAYSHCNNSNMNLNSSLNSSSSSISSCSSSTPSPSNLSPPSSSATSPSSLSSSSSSCISITSMIDFQKLKHEMTNNIVKPKTEQKSNPINLSSFSICQTKMETHPPSNSSSIPIQSNPLNNSCANQNQNNHHNNNMNNTNITSHQSSSNSSHEFTEEEKEGLQISPFLSSVQENYCDITEYLTLPQNQAAKKLQMRPSTFSKRWKEASRNRKWPWRNVRKIDKEITCILHNMPKNGQISEEIENHLTYLLKQRQEELKPVVIRIS